MNYVSILNENVSLDSYSYYSSYDSAAFLFYFCQFNMRIVELLGFLYVQR